MAIWGFSELVYVKYLGQHLVPCNYSINGVYYYMQ